MKEIIRFEDVIKNYGNIKALNKISFSVKAGKIFGIFGPNGAGKTTTIKIMLGIIKPDSGNIKIKTDNFSYLPEELSLDKNDKVITIINYIARLKGIKNKNIKFEVNKWENILKIKALLYRKIRELSKGQKKKVMFLLALIGDPDVIILDEPFSGLDAESSESLKNLVSELKDEGKTILFSTHILEIAENLCEDVLILKEGNVMEYGEINILKEKYSKKGWIIKLKNKINTKHFHNLSFMVKDRYTLEVQDNVSLNKITNLINEKEIIYIKRIYPDFKELYFKSVGVK